MNFWVRSGVITFLILILSGVVKAHLHFIRLALLAAMGLIGLYLIHKLAQDWNKIRGGGGGGGRPGRVLGLFKRSAPEYTELDQMVDDSFDHLPTFESILSQDPMGCARRLVCQIAAKPTKDLQPDEKQILSVLSAEDGFGPDPARDQFKAAAALGRKKRSEFVCLKTFRKCHFTANQMLKLVRLFS
ncbi:unnamed protein product [Bemisia tabaci]|uniref:Uncharacterized protein n=1 Tax=Bemisia tabaci TaxID=7038 RepID=A0A9P0F4U6_BEMTA|nr:PREDICTED: uncharacterized protein LOC109033535 [Bemisia tabaci]CAH0388139.1 unnamed protein product [Bemisia tabaci]